METECRSSPPGAPQFCRKQTRSVQSHFARSRHSLLNARARVPTSDGGILFSSTKITPPCRRFSSAHVLSNGGMVLRSYVTSVRCCAAASLRHSESGRPKNSPLSHSTMQIAEIAGCLRRRPTATAAEMCSSKRSLSISIFCGRCAAEFRGLRQHPFQRLKVSRGILRKRAFSLFRKRLGIVDRGFNFRLRPVEVLSDRRGVPLIALNEQYHFPNGEAAPLYISLPPRRRIAKIDERKLRSPQSLFDKPRACIARRPSMPVRQPLKPIPALRRQPHTHHHRSRFSHSTSIVTVVTIVAHGYRMRAPLLPFAANYERSGGRASVEAMSFAPCGRCGARGCAVPS